MIPYNDLYQLRMAFAKRPLADVAVSPLTQAILQGYEPSKSEVLVTRLLGFLPDAVIAEIMAIDPNSPPPSIQSESDAVDFPALLEAAQLSHADEMAANQVGEWLGQFIEWSSSRSPRTPKLFLESGGLWALALLTAGRAYLPMSFGKVAPNLYLMWVAASGYYAKTTGMSAVEDLVEAIAPHLLTASTNTPEALFAELAGQLPGNMDKLNEQERALILEGIKFGGQRGMIVDEAARLFLNKKSLEGLTQDLLLLFNGGAMVKNQVGTGRIKIPYATFNIFGATTEPQFSYIGQMAWEDGLIARFAMLYPPERIIGHVASATAQYNPPDGLLAVPRTLYNKLPKPPEKNEKRELVAMQIDQEAFRLYQRYHNAMLDMSLEVDQRLRSNYIRFHNLILKVAMLLALADHAERGWVGNPRVLGGHWAKAQQIGETWRYSLHQILAVTQQPEESRAQDAILKLLDRKPDGLTRRDMLRLTNIKTAKVLDTALELLLESGQLMSQQKTSSAVGGRPTYVYQLVK